MRFHEHSRDVPGDLRGFHGYPMGFQRDLKALLGIARSVRGVTEVF